MGGSNDGHTLTSGTFGTVPRRGGVSSPRGASPTRIPESGGGVACLGGTIYIASPSSIAIFFWAARCAE